MTIESKAPLSNPDAYGLNPYSNGMTIEYGFGAMLGGGYQVLILILME